MIFVARLHVPGLRPAAQSFFSFGTFLLNGIARFCKYCLIHSRLRTVLFFFSCFFFFLLLSCGIGFVQHVRVWARSGALELELRARDEREVCVTGRQRQFAPDAKEKRLSPFQRADRRQRKKVARVQKTTVTTRDGEKQATVR